MKKRWRDKDFTLMNVDDYVRERKKNGAKYIYWSKNGAKLFKQFVRAMCVDPFVGRKKPKSIHRFRFMGVRHYIKNQNARKEN